MTEKRNIGVLTMSTLLLAALLLLLSSSVFAADEIKWHPGVYLDQTPEQVTMLFGPPSSVKTERPFAEFVKNRDTGCGNIAVYGYSWSALTAGELVLASPLGPASSVEMWFENNKCFAVKWEYGGREAEAAMDKWATSKDIPLSAGKKPAAVINIGKWKPQKNAVLFVHCYSGGDSLRCKGTITAEYMSDKKE